MTKKLGKLLVVLFIVGALVGAFLRTGQQETEINDLNYELSTTRQNLRSTKEQLEKKENELSDTKEHLTKVADQLNQIRARNEGQFYMRELEE